MPVAPSNRTVAALMRRRILLGGSALCGASMLLATGAAAQTLPAIPAAASIAISAGGAQPTITAPDANTLDVTLMATRTVINWTSFHVSGADSVTFNFAQASDIVLNKSPTAVRVDAGGQVRGLVGASAGGNIWFYSPQGVVISPGAVMTAGNFVFGRGATLVDLDFVDAASPLTVLRTASDALIQIDTVSTATSASINATGDLVLSAASGDLAVTTALAAGSATVSAAAGSVTAGEVTATNGAASVTATGGSASVANLNGFAGASATASVDVSVTSATSGSATGDIILTGGTTASLGSGTSARDVKVLGPTASLGSGSAAGDVFVTATTGSASVTGAVTAGDDIEVTSTAGAVTAGGASLTSTGVGATDDAHVLVRSDTGSATVGAATTQGTGAARGDVTVQAATTASLSSGTSARDVKVLGPTASLGSGSAAGDVFVTATTGSASVTGSVTAGDDIEVTSTAGAVTAGGASLTSTGAGATDDAHVLVRSDSGAATLGSATTQGTGVAIGDVTVQAATVASLSSGTSARDVKVLGPTASLGSGSAAGDVFVTATTGSASVTGSVTAGDDIEVTSTAGAVTAGSGSLTSTGVGATDDAHVLVRSDSGAATVGSATTQGTGAAAGDVTVQAATVASLSSGTSARDVKVLGPTASLGSGSAAGDVFVTATTGSASVTGSVTAGDDIEVTSTAGAVTAGGASLTSTGAGATDDAHVLARSDTGAATVGSATTQGAGAAAGDVTVQAATVASLSSGTSARDVKVLGPTASLGSGAAAGDVFVTATTGSASVTGSVTAGDDIEVTSTAGAVTAGSGSLTSTGVGATDDAHVLVRSDTGSATVGAATTQGTGAAAGDVTVQAATTASLSSGTSARDVKVLGPTASLGSGSAAGDVSVTATTGSASVTGSVTAGDDIEVTSTGGAVTAGSGSLTSTGVGATDDAHVLARSDTGAATVGSATTQGTGAAAGDVTVQAATTASLSSGASARDVKVLGPTASLGSGSAAGDVFVTATTGAASVTGSVTAGDDIEVTSTAGAVTAGSGSLTSTGVGATDDAHVLVRSDSGAATLGSAITQGAGAAAGDVTVQAATAVTLNGAATASRDIQLLAGETVLAGTSVMNAGRDLVARATTGSVTVGVARADDDIALRALTGSVTATGDVEAGQTTAVGDPDTSGAADALLGVAMVGHDVDIRGQTIAAAGHVAAGRAPVGAEILGAAQLASDVLVVATDPDPSALTAALRLATNANKRVSAHRDISLRAENATGGSILTGGLSAGRDIAVYSPAASIKLGSALAGDDIVIRAPNGMIEVTGDLKAGRDAPGMTPADAPGVADELNTAVPLLDFDANPATLFSVVGFDVSLVSQAVNVGGATVAGREPSTDDPDTAGPVDSTTSDVRIQTRLTLTPVLNLAPNIVLGSVTATRDLQIDSAKAISTGDLKAGRDIAVLGRGGVTPGAAPGDHSGSGVTLASARAGDDALAFSIYGRTTIVAGATSGQLFQRLVPTNDRAIDGATEAADQLAIYLRYFDLDDASAPYVLKGGVIHIAGAGVDVGGPLSAQGLYSDVRLRSSADIVVTGSTSAAGYAVFQTDAGGGGAVTTGAVTGREVLLDGAGVVATGTLTATNGDVAVRSRDGGTISLAGISASDDVVVRGTAQATLSGPMTSGSGADTVGVADALRTSDGTVMLEGQTFDLTGGDIDILAGSVAGTGSLAAAGAGSDVRVQSAGAISLGAASAGRDILVDGGAAVTTGLLTAGRDVGVRSLGVGSEVTVGGATAGDDVVIRAQGAIRVTGPLSSGSGTDSAAADQAGDLMFGVAKSLLAGELDLVGRTVDVRSSAGSIQLSGATTAATSARFQTGAITGGSVTVGAVTGREVLLDGAGVVATGTLTATNGDVAVRSRDGGTISLAGISASDDVVVRGTALATLSGAVAAGSGADSAGLGDTLRASNGAVVLEGQTFDLGGGDIDILAGSVTATGALTAAGTGSDVRVQSAGAISLGAASAGRDILVDGGAAVTTGLLTAGRDVGVRSLGVGSAVTVGGAASGDDVVIRARGAITVTGPLSSGSGTDSAATDQAGDLMFGVAKSLLAGELDLVGRTVDVRSSAGLIQVSGATTAATDARFQTGATTGGSVKVGAVTAGRDILLDGGDGAGANGVEATGTLTATDGDVAVRARNGKAINLSRVTAGDDVVLRATGGVTAFGAVATTGRVSAIGLADRLVDATEAGALSVGGLSFDLSSSDIDVIGDGVNILSTSAAGSARIKAGSVSVNGGATVGVDILIDSGASLTVGDLTATGDIALRSRNGSLTVGNLVAGDDIVLRAALGITAISLKSNGVERLGVGDQLFASDPMLMGESLTLQGNTIDVRASGGGIAVGSADSAGDVRLQAVAGDVGVSGTLMAGRDILADGVSVTLSGALTAAGDVAVYGRSGRVSLGSIAAGDDIIVRASGDVTASGALKSGQGAEATGLGDRLMALVGAVNPIGGPSGAGGGVIDVRGENLMLQGPLAAGGEGGSVRLQSVKRTTIGEAVAAGDLLIDAGDNITTGAISAGGDIALRSTEGAVAIASASAGDDVVIRAARSITTGQIRALGTRDVDGVGDRLFALDRTALGGDFDLVGQNIDVKTRTGEISATETLAATGDVRLQSVEGLVTTRAVNAGRDVVLDGAAIKAGAIQAGRDVALRAGAGAIVLGSATAADDLVLRASGDINVTGVMTAAGGADAEGAGDRLFALDRSALGGDFDLTGQTIDLKTRAGAISTMDTLSATGDVRLQAAEGSVTTRAVSAGRDVVLDGASIQAGAVRAGRDVALRAGAGEIILSSAAAGDDLVLRATGAITVTGPATADGGVDAEGAGDRLFATDRTNLSGDFDLSGRTIDVKSSSGAVTTRGPLTSSADIRLMAARGGLTLGDLNAGRDVFLDGGTVDGGAVEAGRDIAARARTGSLALRSARAGDDLVLRAGADIRVAETATAQGGTDEDGAADRLYATDRTMLNGDLALTGANVDVRTPGAITMAGAVSAGRDARFQTTGEGVVSLAAVTAGGDILADGRSVRASGVLAGQRDVALRARAGAVEVASITAGDDIAIRATGAVRASGSLASGSGATAFGLADRLIAAAEGGMISRLIDPSAATAVIEGFALASGDIDIRSGDAITLGGAVTAAGASSLRLQAATRLSVASATAGDTIFARSRDLVLGGAWRAMTARIEITAGGGLALGEGAVAGADSVALSSAQIGMIDAARVQLFAGDSSGTQRGAAIVVGALGVDTAKIRSSLELYAGPLAEVRVTGAFAPTSGAANTTKVRIGAPNAGVGGWTPQSIKVIANDGGSIGVSATTGGRIFTDVRAFGAVELNARTDILMGYQDFIDKLAATSAVSVPSAVRALLAPQTAAGPRMLITAGSLTLRADGKVAQQDTGGLLGLTPTGLYLLGAASGGPQLMLGRTSLAAGTPGLPEYIELNGALSSGATVMTGQSVSLSNLIAFDAGVSPSQFYRLNTCAILQQGACTPSTGHSNISIAPDQLTGLTIEDRTAAAGTADPTVASATNEEGWKDPD